MPPCCISFLIYIKPQLLAAPCVTQSVVFLSLSTSNHNRPTFPIRMAWVVFLSLSTSNHNAVERERQDIAVVFLSLSTSNHNSPATPLIWPELYFFPYLHQTTTARGLWTRWRSCISFLIYIKPQLRLSTSQSVKVVFLSLSTSNHNPS